MTISQEAAFPARQAGVSVFPALLFIGIFLTFWVSLTPFSDLSELHEGSQALDQLTTFTVTALVLGYAASAGLWKELLRPRWPIVLLFSWLAFTSLSSPEIDTALRRVFVAGLVCVNASLLLMLPRIPRQFAALLAFCAITVVVLSFFGVLALPNRAIHQLADVVEPRLAGDWRGVFDHKNMAAPGMVVLIFFALYLAERWSAVAGWLVIAMAGFFLLHTGGKTALGLLPVCLGLGWLLERRAWLGGAVVFSMLIGMNLLTVGAAFVPAIRDFVDGLGIDATFTARADVWNVAMSAVLERPWTGYGFQSFWRTDAVLELGQNQNWAIEAYHAHNAYVELLLDGGIVAVALLVVWLVVLPLRDIRRAGRRGADAGLTRLYTRIWAFGVLFACLEANLFTHVGPMWFSLLVAVFGLNLQARVDVIAERDAR